MKFCSKCGKEIEAGAKFCFACGEAQELVKPRPVVPPPPMIPPRPATKPAPPVQPTPVVQPVEPKPAPPVQPTPVEEPFALPPLSDSEDMDVYVKPMKKKKWILPVIISSLAVIILGIVIFSRIDFVSGGFTKEGALEKYLEAYCADGAGMINSTMSPKILEYVEEERDVTKKMMIGRLNKHFSGESKHEIRNVKIISSEEAGIYSTDKELYGTTKKRYVTYSYEEKIDGEWEECTGECTMYYADKKWYVSLPYEWYYIAVYNKEAE